jgi:hypothetical protein
MSPQARKVIGVSVVLVIGLFAFLWFLGRESRERYAALQTLAATNAPLSTVEDGLHLRFTLCRRGTTDWEEMLSRYAGTNASKWDHRIARKMERTAAVGHTSTIDMQTYIFLDEKDRLVDFEVGAQ